MRKIQTSIIISKWHKAKCEYMFTKLYNEQKDMFIVIIKQRKQGNVSCLQSYFIKINQKKHTQRFVS